MIGGSQMEYVSKSKSKVTARLQALALRVSCNFSFSFTFEQITLLRSFSLSKYNGTISFIMEFFFGEICLIFVYTIQKLID